MKHFVKHIQKELKTHALDYLLFFSGSLLLLVALNIFKGQRLLEFIIFVIYAAFFVIWSLHHHISEGTLHIKAIVEYIILAFLVLFLVSFLVFP